MESKQGWIRNQLVLQMGFVENGDKLPELRALTDLIIEVVYTGTLLFEVYAAEHYTVSHFSRIIFVLLVIEEKDLFLSYE